MNALARSHRAAATRLVLLPRYWKRAIVMATDAVLLSLTMYLALAIVTQSWPGVSGGRGHLIFLAPAVTIPLLNLFGVYDAMVRFVNGDHVLRSVPAILLGCTVLAFASWTYGNLGATWYVVAVFGVGAMVVLSGIRQFAGFVLRANRSRAARERVLVYGAGDAGRQLAAALTQSGRFKVAGFVDDKAELHGCTLLGFTVYPPDMLSELVKVRGIHRILLAVPSATQTQRREILERIDPLQIRAMVMPFLDELASGTKRVDQLREVEIEDLLGRDPVSPIEALLDKDLRGRNVLVTGAGGSIGSELCRQAVKQGARRLVLFEISEYGLYTLERELAPRAQAAGCELVPVLGNVCDTAHLRFTFERYEVETVYHAAAYKHVPLVEQNALSAIPNNVLGTLSAIEEAIAARVRNFVLVSTDKAVNPISIMGATKRACEMAVQALTSLHPEIRASIVRFGNVLDSSGSVVPLFRQQIRNGGPVTVTHPEATRYFMTIPEAAQLVIQAGAMGGPGDIFLLDMGQPVKILDLAQRMIRLSGEDLHSKEAPGGVDISFIGLRPGEKLHEELLVGGNPVGTGHPRIFRAADTCVSWELAQAQFRRMEAAVRANDAVQLVHVLRAFVGGPSVAVAQAPHPNIQLVGGTAA